MPNGAGCWQVVELGLSLHSLYLQIVNAAIVAQAFICYNGGAIN
jgi:hypothetical protein